MTSLPQQNIAESPAYLEIVPGYVTMYTAGSYRATAVSATWTNGTKTDVTNEPCLAFSSNNQAIVFVSQGGILAPTGPGKTTIVAHYLGTTALAEVEVFRGAAPNQIDPIVLNYDELDEFGPIPTEISSTTMYPGEARQIQVQPIFSDGSIGSVTYDPGTKYQVSFTSVATVNATGLLTATATGMTPLQVTVLELSETVTIYVMLRDTYSPVTTFSIGPSSFTGSTGDLFASTQSILSLSAVDQVVSGAYTSGVIFTGVLVDTPTAGVEEGLLEPYSGGFMIAEGTHAVRWASYDRKFNNEVLQSTVVYIDATAPLTSFVVQGSSYVAGGFVYSSPLSTHSLNASDPVVLGAASGVAFSSYSVDGGAWVQSTGPIAMANGVHTVQFRSRDNIGNPEVIRSTTVNVDGTSPAAISDLRSLWPSTSDQATINWTNPGNDGSSGDIPYATFSVQKTSDLATVQWSTANAVLVSSLSVIPGTTQTYLSTGLLVNTTYHFRVWTQDQSRNWSGASNIFSTSTRRDNAPAGLAASEVGISSISWQWSGTGDWRVYYGTSPLVLLSSSATNSHFQGGLSTNTAYSIAVATADPAALNNLAYSLVVYSLAASPAGLDSYGISSHTISLQWQANTNPAGTSYKVSYSTSSQFEATATTTSLAAAATSFTLPGLGPGTQYHFRSFALNGDGLASGFSNTISSTTFPAGPDVTTGLAGTVLGTSSITWSWNAVSGASGYLVYPATGGAPMSITPPFLNQTALSPNVQYGVRVEAVDSSGMWSFKTPPAAAFTLAAAPASLAITSTTASSIAVEWNTQGNSTSTHYEISTSTDEFTLAFSTPVVFASGFTLSSATVFSLQGGTTYWLRGRAQNGAAIATAFSNSTKTATFPDVPFGISGTPLGISSIAWSWGSQGAVNWKVYPAAGGSPLATVSTNSYNYTGLSINTAYGIMVEALNNTGSSGLSDPVTGFTAANPPIAGSLVVNSSNAVTASWTANLNPPGTRYEVSHSTSGDFSPAYYLFTTSSTQQTAGGLQPGTTHYFRVRAYNTGSVPTAFADLGTAFTNSPQPSFISGVFAGGPHDSTAQIVPWTKIQFLSLAQPFTGVLGQGATQFYLGTGYALSAGP